MRNNLYVRFNEADSALHRREAVVHACTPNRFRYGVRAVGGWIRAVRTACLKKWRNKLGFIPERDSIGEQPTPTLCHGKAPCSALCETLELARAIAIKNDCSQAHETCQPTYRPKTKQLMHGKNKHTKTDHPPLMT